MPALRRRLLALVLDRLFILAIGAFPLWYAECLVSISSEVSVNPFFPPFLLPFFISFYLFYVLFVEGLCSGWTLGKKLLGLRVVGEDGKPIGVRASFIRNALRIVDAFPGGLYLLGFASLRKRGARFGDLVAKTKVVEVERKFAIRWPRPTLNWLRRTFRPTIRPFAGFCLVCLVPNALFQAALWEGGEAMAIPKMKGIVIGSWPSDPLERERMLDLIENAGFNAVRMSWEVGAPPTDFVARLEERGFQVLLGTGGGWMTRKTTEDVARMVKEFGWFENICWGIGNEDYAADLSVPRAYLREINEAFKGRSDRPTFHAGHMVLHAPDLLLLRWRGYGPIEFTDVLGYNAYPLFQAASWTGLIEMWWKDTETNPLYQALLDAGLGTYFALEGILVEPLKKNTFGYRYLVYSYLQFAKLKHKPLLITEWGADPDVDFAQGQWEVLRKFPEIRGTFFYSWACVDEDLDCEIDSKELYDYLRGC